MGRRFCPTLQPAEDWDAWGLAWEGPASEDHFKGDTAKSHIQKLSNCLKTDSELRTTMTIPSIQWPDQLQRCSQLSPSVYKHTSAKNRLMDKNVKIGKVIWLIFALRGRFMFGWLDKGHGFWQFTLHREDKGLVYFTELGNVTSRNMSKAVLRNQGQIKLLW